MLTFVLLSLVLTFLALLAVAYPVLIRNRVSEPAIVSAEEAVAELLSQRDVVFQALRELRFDHEVGKITNEDYVAFEGSLKLTAANSLRALDQWEAEADRLLEAEIGRSLAEKASLMASGGVVCPNCGRTAQLEDRFCGGCGSPLPEPVAAPAPVLVCPGCGRPYDTPDQFCAGCGQKLPRVAKPSG